MNATTAFAVLTGIGVFQTIAWVMMLWVHTQTQRALKRAIEAKEFAEARAEQAIRSAAVIS